MRRAFIVYLVISFLFLFHLFICGSSNFSLRGVWADTVPYWIWATSTVWLIIRFWKRFWVKLYAGILAALTLLSLVPMGIPFFAIIMAITGMDVTDLKTLPDNYRMQVHNVSPMAAPKVEIFEMFGPFEKRMYVTPYYGLGINAQDTALNLNYEQPDMKTLESLQVKSFSGDGALLALHFRDTTIVCDFGRP